MCKAEKAGTEAQRTVNALLSVKDKKIRRSSQSPEPELDVFCKSHRDLQSEIAVVLVRARYFRTFGNKERAMKAIRKAFTGTSLGISKRLAVKTRKKVVDGGSEDNFVITFEPRSNILKW